MSTESKNYLVASSVSRRVESGFGEIEILKDVSLTLKEGQSLAIKGASGSGKSTLLALLAGLDVPQSGHVELKGAIVSVLSEDQRAALRANKIGFVFQSFNLIEELTATENVALPLELFGWRNAISVARSSLSALGLEHRLNHFPRQLSGGEQQRVALARAFAIEPELIIADEPTANLDADNANRVLDGLFQLQTDRNTSMIIATHDDSLAARCDGIVHLAQGRVVDAGVIANRDSAGGVNG